MSALRSFPCRTIVECAKRCGKSRPVERICESADDFVWLCPHCLMEPMFNEPPHESNWLSASTRPEGWSRKQWQNRASGRVPRGYQPVTPRACDATQRERPEWTIDDAAFRAVCGELRKDPNGLKNAAIAYLYWRVGLGSEEIAGMVRLSRRAVELRLARLKESASAFLAGRTN